MAFSPREPTWSQGGYVGTTFRNDDKDDAPGSSPEKTTLLIGNGYIFDRAELARIEARERGPNDKAPSGTKATVQEMHMVLTYMREAYIETIAAPGEDAHFKIIELGTEIRRQFELDNLRLTARQGANGHERIIHAIQQLGSSTANLHLRVNHMAARQEIQEVLNSSP